MPESTPALLEEGQSNLLILFNSSQIRNSKGQTIGVFGCENMSKSERGDNSSTQMLLQTSAWLKDCEIVLLIKQPFFEKLKYHLTFVQQFSNQLNHLKQESYFLHVIHSSLTFMGKNVLLHCVYKTRVNTDAHANTYIQCTT